MPLHARHIAVETARKALEGGATMRAPGFLSWPIAGSCDNPPTVTVEGRREAGKHGRNRTMISTDLEVRCRKCGPCLRYRAAVWRYRAQAEYHEAARTWFATFTLKPEEHFKVLCQARVRWTGFDQASDQDQFRMRHCIISSELTKYFKRLRKQTGSKLRYLIVAEKHKSGLPHYHALIHEVSVDSPVRHAQLSGQWRLGFTQFKLVDDPKAAAYVCKYLAKDASARVRASLAYGRRGLIDLCHS